MKGEGRGVLVDDNNAVHRVCECFVYQFLGFLDISTFGSGSGLMYFMFIYYTGFCLTDPFFDS
jgi:hypothetical protein